jgi:hypothetical protein
MEEEAKRVGSPAVNPYSALGKFFRAYLYYQMTMLTGDLPMSEALKSDNFLPKYDSQKEVFKQILVWLEEANTDMASLLSSGKSSFAGDIYYNNNLVSWQKLNNAFTLRVLIALSKKKAMRISISKQSLAILFRMLQSIQFLPPMRIISNLFTTAL